MKVFYFHFLIFKMDDYSSFLCNIFYNDEIRDLYRNIDTTFRSKKEVDNLKIFKLIFLIKERRRNTLSTLDREEFQRLTKEYIDRLLSPYAL